MYIYRLPIAKHDIEKKKWVDDIKNFMFIIYISKSPNPAQLGVGWGHVTIC